MEFVIDILQVFFNCINTYKTFFRDHFIGITLDQEFQYFFFTGSKMKLFLDGEVLRKNWKTFCATNGLIGAPPFSQFFKGLYQFQVKCS